MKSALLILCLAAGGCVSNSEYRAFVVASRGFYDSVAPVVSEATLADPGLSDVSKQNRLKELKAYEAALVAAEVRSK
jgi:hypothetical protein